MTGNNESCFWHKFLLTVRQVVTLRKDFANHSLANTKLSKTQLSKITQSCQLFGNILGPLMKVFYH